MRALQLCLVTLLPTALASLFQDGLRTFATPRDWCENNYNCNSTCLEGKCFKTCEYEGDCMGDLRCELRALKDDPKNDDDYVAVCVACVPEGQVVDNKHEECCKGTFKGTGGKCIRYQDVKEPCGFHKDLRCAPGHECTEDYVCSGCVVDDIPSEQHPCCPGWGEGWAGVCVRTCREYDSCPGLWNYCVKGLCQEKQPGVDCAAEGQVKRDNFACCPPMAGHVGQKCKLVDPDQPCDGTHFLKGAKDCQIRGKGNVCCRDSTCSLSYRACPDNDGTNYMVAQGLLTHHNYRENSLSLEDLDKGRTPKLRLNMEL